MDVPCSNYGHVIRHTKSCFQRRFQGARRNGVVITHNTVRPGLELQQLLHCIESALVVEQTGDNPSRGHFDPVGRARFLKPVQTTDSRCRLRSADVR